MIKFSLQCERDHAFEGWFRNNADFETQSKRGFVELPALREQDGRKGRSWLRPSRPRGKKDQIAVAMGAEQRAVLDQLREMSKKVRENSEYVGGPLRRGGPQDPFRRDRGRVASTARPRPRKPSRSSTTVSIRAAADLSRRPELRSA